MPLTSFFLYGLFLVHTLRLPLPPPPAPRSKDSSPPPPLPPGHANLPPKGGDAIITITKLKIALAATFTPPCHITRPSPSREINCKEQCRRGGPRPPPQAPLRVRAAMAREGRRTRPEKLPQGARVRLRSSSGRLGLQPQFPLMSVKWIKCSISL